MGRGLGRRQEGNAYAHTTSKKLTRGGTFDPKKMRKRKEIALIAET